MEKKLVIKWYESLDSTNMQAQRELPEALEGTVWVADYQSAGRGQRGNSWESGAGENLLFTVLLRPDFLNVADQFAISQVVALSVVKYLETMGLSPKIKWPNDIYVGDKKICGILIEHSISGANLSASILGVGINVNQRTFCSDAPNPTSMVLALDGVVPDSSFCSEENSAEFDRKKVLAGVMQQLFALYESLYIYSADSMRLFDAQGREALDAEYHSYLYRLGEFHDFIEVEGERKSRITARIVGINGYGCLVLEKEDGKRAEYAFQQIRYII